MDGGSIFGSAARGDFDCERSDVDFIVELERDTPLYRIARPSMRRDSCDDFEVERR